MVKIFDFSTITQNEIDIVVNIIIIDLVSVFGIKHMHSFLLKHKYINIKCCTYIDKLSYWKALLTLYVIVNFKL